MALDDLVLGIATAGLYNLWKATRRTREAVRNTGASIEGITDDLGDSAAATAAAMAQIAGDLTQFVGELEGLMTVRGSHLRSEDELLDAEVGRLRLLRATEQELLDALARRGVDAEAAGAWRDALRKSESAETLRLLGRLAIVRGALDDLLYAEPGVVPACLYDLEEALTRFTMFEQTGIEDLIATARDTAAESGVVLADLAGLLVARTYRPVDPAALSPEAREELGRLRSSRDLYDRLLERNTNVLAGLQEELLQVHPDEWDGHPDRSPENPVTLMPKGARIARSLHRTEISAYLGNHAALIAINQYYERERLRVEKRIASLTHVPVEEPGVIPVTLEETRLAIERFRVEGQPRLELLIDNLNAALAASKGTAARTERILATVEAAAAWIPKNPLLFTIGAALLLAIVAAILVVLLILLVRLALAV